VWGLKLLASILTCRPALSILFHVICLSKRPPIVLCNVDNQALESILRRVRPQFLLSAFREECKFFTPRGNSYSELLRFVVRSSPNLRYFVELTPVRLGLQWHSSRTGIAVN
jgi:hypothetical protein